VKGYGEAELYAMQQERSHNVNLKQAGGLCRDHSGDGLGLEIFD